MARTKNECSCVDLKPRVEELERTVKALVEAMVDIEKDQEAEYMPEGTYYGQAFEQE